MTQIRLTPSLLAWLRCFESAARCRSFTRAAAELFVTQGAVSQQVKQLEDWIGRPLFLRTPRALVLTPEGRSLAAILQESFKAIEGTLAQIREMPEGAPLLLSCAPSFAIGWLTPRLGDLFRAHPNIGLRVIGEFHALDHERMLNDEVAAAVRFDLGRYDDLQATAFLDEWLLPVASPGFLAAHPALAFQGKLEGQLLLHDTSAWVGADPYAEWAAWLLAAGWDGVLLDKGQHFNLSQLAVSAALAGQGLAMGRLALVLDDLLAGRLVAPFPIAVRSQASYFFVTAMNPARRTRDLHEWLREEAGRFCRVRDDFLRQMQRQEPGTGAA